MTISIPNLEPETHVFQDDGSIPNSRLPLLVYRGAFPPQENDLPRLLEQTFAEHNWSNAWRNGVYSYHHYHSTAHEVLAVYRGRATLQLGGEGGNELNVQAGDVLVIPAGVGHKNLRSSVAFGVVGAYPNGMDYDLLKGEASDRPCCLEKIAAVAIPTEDPIFGIDGPLLKHWMNS